MTNFKKILDGSFLANFKNRDEGKGNPDEKVLTPKEACKKIEDHPDTVLIDIRESNEMNTEVGCLKNSINIPRKQFESRLHELEKHRDKEIIVYCAVGFHSYRVMLMMEKSGYSHVYSLLGGIRVWTNNRNKNIPELQELLVKETG